ncbi:FliM/FliN family flagellar motor switch protein [Novosphingobium lindaniclasticum]
MTGGRTTPKRTTARHSAELVASGPALAELVPALVLIGERLTRALAIGLARLSGTDAPIVRAGMPMDATLSSLQGEIEGLAAHTLMVLGPAALPLLATFEAAPVFRLVDRAFGGPGEVPTPLPESFPLSAELLLAHIESCVAEALTFAFGARDDHRVRPLRRDTSLRQLDPFASGADLLTLSLDIEEPEMPPWSLLLAIPVATLAEAVAAPRREARGRPRRFAAPEPTDEPFASMPLEVTAVLVDMRLSMARLSALRTGDVLPVAVARSVPLQVGGRTLASGTIGELDDRVAVQITHAF